MTQHLHPLATHNNSNLRDLIIRILDESNSVLTLDEILIGLKRYKFPFDLNKTKIRGVLTKLSKKGIVEFVYIDLSYGIRLANQQNNDHSNIQVVT